MRSNLTLSRFEAYALAIIATAYPSALTITAMLMVEKSFSSTEYFSVFFYLWIMSFGVLAACAAIVVLGTRFFKSHKLIKEQK